MIWPLPVCVPLWVWILVYMVIYLLVACLVLSLYVGVRQWGLTFLPPNSCLLTDQLSCCSEVLSETTPDHPTDDSTSSLILLKIRLCIFLFIHCVVGALLLLQILLILLYGFFCAKPQKPRDTRMEVEIATSTMMRDHTHVQESAPTNNNFQMNDAAISASSMKSKVDQICNALEIDPSLPLTQAVQSAHSLLKITPQGSLTEQVDTLHSLIFLPADHKANANFGRFVASFKREADDPTGTAVDDRV